jgi:hypothetical protein
LFTFVNFFLFFVLPPKTVISHKPLKDKMIQYACDPTGSLARTVALVEYDIRATAVAVSAGPPSFGDGWLTPEMTLRLAAFGGLVFAFVLIMQQRSYCLGFLFAIALGLLLFIEFGPGGKLLSTMLRDDIKAKPSGRREL